jgi:uncharacterized protein YbjT (DUF2867 family)
MKTVVIGGSSFLGAKLVGALRDEGHEVLAASPRGGATDRRGTYLGAASLV